MNSKFLVSLVLRLLRIFLNHLQNSRDKRLLLSLLWSAYPAPAHLSYKWNLCPTAVIHSSSGDIWIYSFVSERVG